MGQAAGAGRGEGVDFGTPRLRVRALQALAVYYYSGSSSSSRQVLVVVLQPLSGARERVEGVAIHGSLIGPGAHSNRKGPSVSGYKRGRSMALFSDPQTTPCGAIPRADFDTRRPAILTQKGNVLCDPSSLIGVCRAAREGGGGGAKGVN